LKLPLKRLLFQAVVTIRRRYLVFFCVFFWVGDTRTETSHFPVCRRYLCAYVCMYVYVCMYAHIHTYIHTYITFMYVYMCRL